MDALHVGLRVLAEILPISIARNHQLNLIPVTQRAHCQPKLGGNITYCVGFFFLHDSNPKTLTRRHHQIALVTR